MTPAEFREMQRKYDNRTPESYAQGVSSHSKEEEEEEKTMVEEVIWVGGEPEGDLRIYDGTLPEEIEIDGWIYTKTKMIGWK